jgi:DNA-binding transcriptional MerR regulator
VIKAALKHASLFYEKVLDFDAASTFTMGSRRDMHMDYTISALAKLAGVSTRTLRYYDEIGLLRPKNFTEAGYRVYGTQEVDKLQQILFYREMGVGLDDINRILTAPAFKRLEALETHLAALRNKRSQVDAMIANVQQTIASEKGETTMTDEEKFEGLKNKLVRENEEQYGEEVRSRYGSETVDESNAKFKNMTQQQYARMQTLSEEIAATLKAAIQTKDPAGELAQKACALHKQWLMCTWESYSSEAHKGLAQMYVDDERFTAYYDKIEPGCAVFLRDAIMIFCS